MLPQGMNLAGEARGARGMAGEMLAPAVTAAARAGHIVQSVRDEILHAADAADHAREALTALREAMAVETEKLVEGTQDSVHVAHQLVDTLGRERTEMDALAQTLDLQATKVV